MQLGALLACLWGILFAHTTPAAELSISVSTATPALGDPLVVEVAASGTVDNLSLVWNGASWPVRGIAPGKYQGVIGVDLLAAAVPATVAAEGWIGGERSRAEAALDVTDRKFPVQRLSLPKKMAEFDPPTLARIEAEARDLEARFARVTPPVWSLPFLTPVAEYRPENFGSRRVINGEPRMPHAAVDVRLPEGTPVRSIADGVVAFAGDRFFGGLSVVVDHGGGVFSVYYHLKEFSVSEGDRVARGAWIGAIGSTGRATGPHLHFGVRVPGGRVDPTRLFALPAR